MVAAGGYIYASDVLRARPKRYWAQSTATVPPNSSGVAAPSATFTFTTETDGAELELEWFIELDQNGSSGTGSPTATSARPLVTGPSSFSQQPPVFAMASVGTSTARSYMSTGNTHVMTLGVAGTYTVTLPITTSPNQSVEGYTSIKGIVQEQFS